MWTAVAGSELTKTPEQLPAGPSVDDTLSEAAARAIAAGVPAETRRAYAGDWLRFETWCAGQGRTALPATSATLAEYATHLGSLGRAPSTIDRALAAIRARHRGAGLQPADSLPARLVLRGLRRERAKQGKRPRKAAPVTVEPLRKMAAACDTATAIGARDRALLLLGFATAARRSELAALNLADITEVEEGLQVVVRTSKTDAQSLGRTVAVPYGSNPATCPVRAVRVWLAVRSDAGLGPGPLFVRVNRHSRLAAPLRRQGRLIGDPAGRLTGEAIADAVARAAERAGLAEVPDGVLAPEVPRWSGHSLRRGFATASRRAGHDLVRIGRHGGWVDGSKVLYGYLEDVDHWEENPLIGVGL
jgi:integrase